MTFLLSINIAAPGSTDLDRKLLTGGVSQELAPLPRRLDILGAAGRFINRPTLLGTLASTDLTVGRF